MPIEATERARLRAESARLIDEFSIELHARIRYAVAQAYAWGFVKPGFYLDMPTSSATVKQYLYKWFEGYPKVNPYMQTYGDEMKLRMFRIVDEGVDAGKYPLDVAREMAREMEMERYKLERIARTEMMRAYNAATLDRYLMSGLKTKAWSAAHDACFDCIPLNEEEVLIGNPFSNGLMMPPAHPNCRCSLIPGRDVYDNLLTKLAEAKA